MRGRGLGRVFQRKYRDKRTGELKVAATYTLEYYVAGKKRREPSSTTSYTRAVRFLRHRLGEIAQGRRVDPAGERLTPDQLADNLVNDYKANGRRSLERVEDALAHLRAAFSGYRAQEITGDMLTKYVVDRQQEGAQNATINREQAALKRMYHLAAERLGGYCPTIHMLKEDNVRKGFLERPVFDVLLAALPDYLRALIVTAYITGWRTRELLTRQRHHVDLEAGWLRLEPGETKNGKGRMFPLDLLSEFREFREALEGQLAATREFERRTGQVVPWLFHHDGQPIRSFRRAWVAACKRAGLVRVVMRGDREIVYPLRTPHDFCRTAIRNLERAGVPRSAAMAMVGRETEAIYRRYAIVDETMLREAAAKYGAFLQAQQLAATVVPLPRRLGAQVGRNRASHRASGR